MASMQDLQGRYTPEGFALRKGGKETIFRTEEAAIAASGYTGEWLNPGAAILSQDCSIIIEPWISEVTLARLMKKEADEAAAMRAYCATLKGETRPVEESFDQLCSRMSRVAGW